VPRTISRDVVVLGCTGSVGTQALDVIRRNPDRFRVVGLGAGGSQPELLAAQVAEFAPEVVAVADQTVVAQLPEGTKTLTGPEAMTELAGSPCDVVLNAITGSIGLAPTLAALDAGHILALANKESLIVGGPLVAARAQPGQIVPVDSEHSALAQCLWAGQRTDISRLILTASGGPFRGRIRDELRDVTPEQALAHPTWDMGPVISVNSATLVNKGLELIEAHLLFNVPFECIDVLVHPQSIVHSMVEFSDGATIAQASPPDMRLPIALALGWPHRVAGAAPGLDLTSAMSWEFTPLDESAFPAVPLARAAGQTGRTAPAVFNAANEECVAAFLAGRLPFLGIVDTIANVLDEHQPVGNPPTLADVLQAEDWARGRARELTGHRGRPDDPTTRRPDHR
jgi:1-deoxy-D-xylulose-5-phosphate reductoisomerase